MRGLEWSQPGFVMSNFILCPQVEMNYRINAKHIILCEGIWKFANLFLI